MKLSTFPLVLTQYGEADAQEPRYSIEGTLPPSHPLSQKTGLTRTALNDYFMRLGMQSKQRNEIFRALAKDHLYSVTVSMKSAADLEWPFVNEALQPDTPGRTSVPQTGPTRKSSR
jgi:hypothetical protein